MSFVVSLSDFTPSARQDGLPWTQAQIAEGPSSSGPFTTIETINLSPVDADPSNPAARSFTTTHATLSMAWYLVTLLDAAGNQQPFVPIPYPPPAPQATMPYCSVLDAQSRNAARTVTPSSVPNIAQVQQFVADAAAEINGILVNKGYQIPIISASNPDAFALLHSLNVTGAWSMMEAAAPNSPNLDRAAKAWDEAKKMLGDAKFVLNAPQDMARSEPRGPWQTFQPTGEVYDPMFAHRGDGISTDGRNRPQHPYFSRQMRF